MATRWARKISHATVVALGLYAVSLGLPLPDSCVAGAAPSPSCSGDLRECLRASARQDMFARWVTAEDVARCMEAFRSCINGGASRGGNPVPPTTTARRDSSTGLPQHFGIKAADVVYDCTRSGEAITCTGTRNLSEGWDSITEEVTGTLSGLTMTGSLKRHGTGHAPAMPGCRSEHDSTGPVTYVFNLDGTVTMRAEPHQWNTTWSGCGADDGPRSGVTDAWEATASWSSVG